MIIAALILFACAAILGLFLLSYILRNKNTPKGVALIHGFLAGTGILLLAIIIFTYSPKPYLSFIIFILAALGGAYIMYRDITGKTLPKWLALGHGMLAVIAFVFLLLFTLAVIAF